MKQQIQVSILIIKYCFSVYCADELLVNEAHCAGVPAGHPVKILRGSFLPGACQGVDCAESPGSLCRCPEPETEPSGPRVEQGLLWCDSTAAAAPKHSFHMKHRMVINK